MRGSDKWQIGLSKRHGFWRHCETGREREGRCGSRGRGRGSHRRVAGVRERHVPRPESGRERTRSRSRNWNPTRERDAHVQNDLGPTRAGERVNIEKGESQRVCSREARPSGIHIARGPPARNRFLLHMPSMIICCSTCGPSRSHPPSAKGVHMAIVLRQKRAHPQAARVLHAASPASSACPLCPRLPQTTPRVHPTPSTPASR